jgi:hypothetical protein
VCVCVCVFRTHFLNHVAKLQEQCSRTVPLEDEPKRNLIISYNEKWQHGGWRNFGD